MRSISPAIRPPSIAEGRAARAAVEEARAAVAALAGAEPAHVVFTSGATEAACHVLTPDFRMGRAPLAVSRLHVGATEHVAVLAGGRFPRDRVSSVPVGRDGLVDPDVLASRLAAHDGGEGPPMVAVQLVNNETGVIQPVAAISRAVKAHGGILVVDAVQAAGRIPLSIGELGADFLILSSHKIGGPKGAGALVSSGEALMPAALISRRRAGTGPPLGNREPCRRSQGSARRPGRRPAKPAPMRRRSAGSATGWRRRWPRSPAT